MDDTETLLCKQPFQNAQQVCMSTRKNCRQRVMLELLSLPLKHSMQALASRSYLEHYILKPQSQRLLK